MLILIVLVGAIVAMINPRLLLLINLAFRCVRDHLKVSQAGNNRKYGEALVQHCMDHPVRHTMPLTRFPLTHHLLDASIGAASEPYHRLDQAGSVLREFGQALRQGRQRQNYRAEGIGRDLARSDGGHDGCEI